MPLHLIAVIVLLASHSAASQAARQPPTVAVPETARPFVAEGTRPVAFEPADLNRDGRQDAVLVVEEAPAAPARDDPDSVDVDGRQRTLIVLVGEVNGTFREAKRNGKVVYCSECGGIMGDPFQEVSVGPGTFTVINAGGSNWRWAYRFTFNYSRRDDTWQLVLVQESNYHISEIESAKPDVLRPPKDYGKIDIADFDPENWKGQGKP